MSRNKKTLIDGDFQVGSNHFKVDTDNNYVGFNNATPQNKIDVQIGVRTGTHSTDKPLYVTGVTATSGAEFVSDDGTAGIGIGSSNIFTTETNQNITIAPNGTGAVGIKTATPNPSGETFDLWVQGDTKITGNVTAGHLYGDGSGLFNVAGTQWVSSSEDIYFLNNTGSGEGKVGIGKTVPEYKLDILDSGKPTIRVKSTSAGHGDALLILDSSATGESDIDFNHDGVLNWRIRTGDASASGTSFQVNNANDSDVLTIQQNGDVGIGTDSPNVPLEVNKSAGGEMFRLATSTGTLYAGADANPPWFGTSSDDHLRLVTNGTEKVRIENGGNVGIGKTDPGSALDVNGTVTATSFTGALNGNASTATTLQTARTIGGVSFDGSANITPTTFGGATFSGDVAFDTNTLFVDVSTNRVGIGTTSPEATLHLYQSAGSTNLVEKHTNASTVQYQQHMNYTHYASVAGGPSRDPDNSRGLWIGNMVDENDGSPSGANFAAFTDSFQFYAVADRTKYDSSLSFTSNTDNLLYSGGTFNKVMRIGADGTVTATTFAGALSGNATSATDADTVDGIHASSFLRSDADDTVNAGVTYTWSATNTHGIAFKNSSYNTFLYLGGWSSTSSDNISRIRTSSGNLHIDSAHNGNCYLNWYSAGTIELGRNTNVRGTVTATTFTGALSGNASTATSLKADSTANRLNVYSSTYAKGYNSAALEIREYNLQGASGGTEWERAPRIGFHWSGRIASQIICDSGGTINIANNPGTGYERLRAGAIEARGEFYTNSKMRIQYNNPTINFQDTDHLSSFIHNNGNLLYILRGNTNATTWTQVNGQWPFIFNMSNNDATCGGNFYAVGNVTAYSDIRHKTNIVKIGDSLNKVHKLSGYTYNRKDTGKRYTGLIAQEVQEILPEAVNKDSKGELSVAYGNMTGLLVEAIKELTTQLKTERERVDVLSKKIGI